MLDSSLSSCGGENEGSMWWGGCGNRDSENVEGVGVVCVSLKRAFSEDNLEAAAGNCDRRSRVDFLSTGGGDRTSLVAAGGLGSLFLVLKMRTLLSELAVESLDMLLL